MSAGSYSPSELTKWIAAVFEGCRVPAPAAAVTAENLVRTSARGIDTHGVARVLSYIEKLRSDDVNPRPTFAHDASGGVLRFDADGGLGQYSGAVAVDMAVGIARDTPIVVALIKNLGHLGALGLLALRAAERGMFAFLCQQGPPVMALPGASGPTIGNNPIAFACPVRNGDPIVFDMACSVVARGNLLMAARDTKPIPDGWAIAADGRPTTDAKLALEGAVLPVGGHKGIGIAMMVECLAGSLTGASPPKLRGGASAASRVGAFLLVANPALITDRTSFDAHVASWCGEYLRASGDMGRLPGGRAAAAERRALHAGIDLSESVVSELRKAGNIIGVEFNLRPMLPGRHPGS